MTCDKHKSEVCEPCAYERGFRKALEIVRDGKPVDTRGCSDPECCGNGPDAEYCFEQVIETLEAHLKEQDKSSEGGKTNEKV